MRALVFVAGLLPLVACTTTLSTMQPAAALPKGKFHTAVGMGGSVAPGPIVDIIQSAVAIAQNPDPSEEEKQDFLTAGLALALTPPGVQSEYAVRYGLGEGFDLGVRYTVNSLQAEGKYQFLRSEDTGGFDASIGLGVGHHIFTGVVFDVLEALEINDFSRNDVSGTLMFGRHPNDAVHYWFGPKYITSRYKVDSVFETVGAVNSSEGSMHYIGGSAGVALGWRYVWFVGELTVMDLIFNANVLGADRDLGGVVIYPAGGIMARF